MRIRTIKPEFWAHPIMTRLPHDSRLLAIALLNLADDHGYFEADIDYIRGSVLFREDSKNVRRMIQDLSRAGWIELSGSEERPIGRVVNFSKHQRVDKPQPSKLQQYWDSKNVLGMILEESKIDPRGNREQGTGNGKESTVCSRTPRFTREQVDFEAQKCGLPEQQADQLWNYYSANGWKTGRNPVKSLPHLVAGWTARWRERQHANNNTPNKSNPRNVGVAKYGPSYGEVAAQIAANGGSTIENPDVAF